MQDASASPVRIDQHQEGLKRVDDLLLQMATVIRQQADAIVDLRRRVAALEESVSQRISRPASSGTSCSAGGAPNPLATPQPDPAGPAAVQASAAERVSDEANIQVSAPDPQPGIFFRGTVYGGSGYAEENWRAALALAEHQIPVQLVPTYETSDSGRLIPAQSRQLLAALQEQLVDLARSVVYNAATPDTWELAMFGRRRVGRTMFETDRVPHLFVERCNAMDEVWLPSRFNMETFAASGVKEEKLRLVPGGVDVRVFRPGVQPLPVAKKRRFNFLSVFDWQRRKGYDALLKAYLREFKADDDVALILKVTVMNGTTSDLDAEINFFIEREAGTPLEKAPPVILIKGSIPQEKIASLYAAADCFVLPSRGEGYCRPYLEALACELPVIATNWGGQRDFLNSRNSYLIETNVVPVGDDVDAETYRGHRWCEPNVGHLRELMREVYSHPDQARRKAKQGREDVLRRYDWNVVIPRWVQEFRRLLD
jgi:glycosyltransferase involved in cell wall biosynthesis